MKSKSDSAGDDRERAALRVSSNAKKREKPRALFSLRALLTVSHVLMIGLVVLITGYVSTRNGQAAINEAIDRFRSATANNIRQHVEEFLKVPVQINELNAKTIQIGALDPSDAAALQRFFLEEAKIHPTVSSVYFGNAEGGLAGAGREGAENRFYFTRTADYKSGLFQKVAADGNGQPSPTILASLPNFDARTRPWYQKAEKKGDVSWSEIYVLFTGQDMALSASKPVYDSENRLIGVVSVDVFLSQISAYLNSLDVASIGEAFIMERSGALVAASGGEALFRDNGGKKERAYFHQSGSPAIRQAGRRLVEMYGDLARFPSEEQRFEFDLEGETQYAQVFPVTDPYGIDWIVVTVLPESAFMERIERGNRATLLVIVSVAVAAASLGALIASRISRRIALLSAWTRKLAAGEWEHEAETDGHIIELNELAASFNQMKERLQTALERLRQEAREHERASARFRSLFAQTNDAVFLLDLSGRHIAVNQRAADMLGYTVEELLNLSVHDTSAEMEASENVLQRLLAGEKIPPYERKLRRKNGEIFPVEMNVELVRNANGAPAHIQSVARDITERKRMEEALRASEEKYRLVAENAHDWAFWQAPDGRFVYSSPACLRIAGHEADEFLQDPTLLLKVIHPDDREAYLSHQKSVIKERVAGEVEFRILRPDGTEVWVSHVCQPIFDEEGNYLGERGSNHDVTERKRAELALEQANLELRELQRELREQAMRDPLTGLYNRRYMEEAVRREFARAARETYPISVVMLDMDNLKRINDAHGHAVGDLALQALADCLKTFTRAEDIACRYGGDEFYILMSRAKSKNALKRVEEWRRYLEEHPVQADETTRVFIQFSAGVACFPEHGKTLDEVNRCADDALYQAKQAGRNRSVQYQPRPPE